MCKEIKSNGELPTRHCVSLPWGLLYSTSDFGSDDETISQTNASVKWSTIAPSVMTVMVLSLDSIRVFGDIINTYFDTWTVSQFSDILMSFEVLYWHARSFNASTEIRKRLFGQKFMVFPDDPKRHPHLLEQEVFSLSKILEISTKLYNQSTSANREFATPWVKR